MKPPFLKTFLAAFVLVVALPAQAIVVSVNPSAQTVSLGSSVSVDINIDGLGDGAAPSLGTYDIDLGFDATLLSFANIQFGTQLDVLGLGSIQSFSPSAGAVNLFELSLDLASDLDALQAKAFTLATLTFDTLAVGQSLLSINLNALGDAVGDPLEAVTADGSIGIATIPEPSSALLMMIGFAALGATAARTRTFIVRWT